LQWYHNKGLKVMGATAASYGNSPFMPRENSLASYIKDFSRLVAENRLEGILSTAWDDGSPHPETVWRGYIAQGEYGWNPTARSVEAFKTAHAQREYGFHPNDNRMTFLDELEQEAYFFDNALVDAGRRNPAWGTTSFTLIGLPDPTAPGAWSRTYQSKIEQAKTEAKRHAKICQGIKEAKQHALRNRYTLEIYEQNNHLFNFPPRLILALHYYDTAANDTDRQTALQQINKVCDDFSTLRKQLEETYSQTRFMQQPEGYIADQNHHNHLAAKTNNSDWWYYYEIPMVRKTRTWANSLIAR
ncbi:MAG: glycoside hydrolase, partial [Rikenellaceae bacterium]|nr:glycoside hydrolase [Rikenellaceae bacterium]